MFQLKGGQASNLGNFRATVSNDFFQTNSFGVRNVDTKTFVLLLASQQPLSFVSGSPVDLAQKLKDYNKTEFHHMMPRKYVDSLTETDFSVNCLANFCFVSRSENRTLGGDKPSVYKNKMPSDVTTILERALCPDSLFSDDFDKFIQERTEILTRAALSRIS
jgi:hypothetical protein